MKHVLACVAAASVLSACGGGGSGASGPVTPPATAPFAKYVGDWKDACQFHHRETVTVAITAASATTVTLSDRIEYFDNADCSGALVATGVYSAPIATLQYVATENNAIVHLQSGLSLTGAVDRGTAAASDATVSFSGSGVSSSVLNGKTVWHIAYSGGGTDIQINNVLGANPGGLFLNADQLYVVTASAGSNNSFDASAALTR
jgi:hypothetical protein